MGKTVNLDGLEAALKEILEEYNDDVIQRTKECVKKVGEAGAKTLREVSPRKTGKYAGGWRSKLETSRLSAQATIYNGRKPGLPHLLEYGHVTRNGTGRTFPRTQAHPHILAVEERINKDFENAVKVELGK